MLVLKKITNKGEIIMSNISKTSTYRHIDTLAKIFKKKYPKWHLSIRKNSCWRNYQLPGTKVPGL